MLFSQRIQARHDKWYPARTPWWPKRINPLHVGMEFRAVMRASDSDAKWQCCEFWQRKLFNKWNIREFAKKHGCRVPKLYWHGRDLATLDFDSLPQHFVIRATRGTSRKKTLVMAEGVNLLENRHYSNDQLRLRCSELLSSMKYRPSSRLLVEEFVRSERKEYVLPTDFRFHVFGGMVGAIGVTDITGAISQDPGGGVVPHQVRQGGYGADWIPFEDSFHQIGIQAQDMPAPDCLPEMLGFAETLGRAVGSYMRVDLYATAAGAVVGEFAPTPGRGGYSHFADQLLGRLWSQFIPDQI